MQCRRCRKVIKPAKGFWLPNMGFYCSYCAEIVLLYWKNNIESWYGNVFSFNEKRKARIETKKGQKKKNRRTDDKST